MDRAYVISAILGAIVNITGNIILIPNFGSIGASISTLLAEAIVCIYQSNAVKRYQPILLYIKKSLPFLFSGVLMFFVIFIITLPFSNIVNLFIKIILGVCVYFIILICQLIIYKVVTKKAFFNFNKEMN